MNLVINKDSFNCGHRWNVDWPTASQRAVFGLPAEGASSLSTSGWWIATIHLSNMLYIHECEFIHLYHVFKKSPFKNDIYIYRCTDNFPIIIPITISMYGGFQTVPRFIAGGYMHGSWAQQIVYGKRRVAVLWPVTDFRTRINFLCLFWIAKSSFLRLQSLQSLFLVAYPISIAYVTISQHPLASKFALKYTNQIWRVNWNLKVGWLTTISMILLSTLYLVVTWLNQVQSMRLNLAPSSEQSWFTTHNII